MKLDRIPTVGNKSSRRVGCGRGNGHGKTCGRGHKGAGQRSGYGTKLGFEGGQMPLYRKLPRRGFSHARFDRETLAWVNVEELDRFEPDENIDMKQLQKAGLVRGNASVLKILGNGELTKALTIEANKFSASAKQKIEAAGGKAVLV